MYNIADIAHEVLEARAKAGPRSDCTDALNRILALRVTRPQDRPAVREEVLSELIRLSSERIKPVEEPKVIMGVGRMPAGPSRFRDQLDSEPEKFDRLTLQMPPRDR
jgi:hypothetical protein